MSRIFRCQLWFLFISYDLLHKIYKDLVKYLTWRVRFCVALFKGTFDLVLTVDVDGLVLRETETAVKFYSILYSNHNYI